MININLSFTCWPTFVRRLNCRHQRRMLELKIGRARCGRLFVSTCSATASAKCSTLLPIADTLRCNFIIERNSLDLFASRLPPLGFGSPGDPLTKTVSLHIDLHSLSHSKALVGLQSAGLFPSTLPWHIFCAPPSGQRARP